jgi:hypothetical protein
MKIVHSGFRVIQTTYFPATNYRGSRVKAQARPGMGRGEPSVTIPYPHEAKDAHDTAFQALLKKMDWDNEIHVAYAGEWARGRIYLMTRKEETE